MTWKEWRRLARAAVLFLHVLLGMLLALAVLLLPMRRRLAHRLGPWWLRRGIAILGVRVMAHGRPAEEPGFRLDRQESADRRIRYSLHPYAADQPRGQRYAAGS